MKLLQFHALDARTWQLTDGIRNRKELRKKGNLKAFWDKVESEHYEFQWIDVKANPKYFISVETIIDEYYRTRLLSDKYWPDIITHKVRIDAKFGNNTQSYMISRDEADWILHQLEGKETR